MGRHLAGKLPGTMRRDPGQSGSVSFGFVDLPPPGRPTQRTYTPLAVLHGRLGAAERDLHLETSDTGIRLRLTGWYTDTITLDKRQAMFLLDALSDLYLSDALDD
jgi:hypothetical protein